MINKNKIIIMLMLISSSIIAVVSVENTFIPETNNTIPVIGGVTATFVVIENNTPPISENIIETSEWRLNVTNVEIQAIYDKYYKIKSYDTMVAEINTPKTCNEANINFIEINQAVLEEVIGVGRWTKTDYKTLNDANEFILQYCQKYPELMKSAQENKDFFYEEMHKISLRAYEEKLGAEVITDYTDQWVYDASCDCKVLGDEYR